MPKFESALETLYPMAITEEELKEEVIEKPEDKSGALVANLLSNSETAVLLKALAKSL